MESKINETRWKELFYRLCGSAPPTASFARVLAAYSEGHRYYHNLSHIEQCLAELAEVRATCCNPDEVEVAVWLHDVIYDPHASDNEEMSAKEARQNLTESGCDELKIKKVEELILVTKHAAPPRNVDEELIVDIDLSILGQAPPLFGRYQEGIRKEYAWVPEEAYRQRRSQILRSFLSRTSIYHTDSFRRRYEEQARLNLMTALSALSGGR